MLSTNVSVPCTGGPGSCGMVAMTWSAPRSTCSLISGQYCCGNGEVHINGINLIDDNNRHIRYLHQIAGLHHDRAGPSVNRRVDRAVFKIEFRCLDGGLVGIHNGIGRIGCAYKRVNLLSRDYSLDRKASCSAAPGRDCTRRGLVASERGFCLRERGLIGPRVDGEQYLSLVNEITLFEMDVLDLTGNLRPDRDRWP